MLRDSTSCILASRLCTPALRQQILNDLRAKGTLKGRKQPAKPDVIQPFKDIDMVAFAKIVRERCTTLGFYGSGLNRQTETLPPP
jgi:hypothetical protein